MDVSIFVVLEFHSDQMEITIFSFAECFNLCCIRISFRQELPQIIFFMFPRFNLCCIRISFRQSSFIGVFWRACVSIFVVLEFHSDCVNPDMCIILIQVSIFVVLEFHSDFLEWVQKIHRIGCFNLCCIRISFRPAGKVVYQIARGWFQSLLY